MATLTEASSENFRCEGDRAFSLAQRAPNFRFTRQRHPSSHRLLVVPLFGRTSLPNHHQGALFSIFRRRRQIRLPRGLGAPHVGRRRSLLSILM